MKFSSIPHRVLLLLFSLSFMIGSESHVTTEVQVKFNQNATLVCENKCSIVKWSTFKERNNVLAQCDKTSCRSQSGYTTSYDEYVRGNQTLIITAVDFTKRQTYTCECDDVDVCDVHLIISPLISSVELNQFTDLVMDVHVIEPVKLIYKRHSSGESKEICRMEAGGKLQCSADYKHRVLFHHTIMTLKGVTPDDSGVYSIRYSTDEEIHIYSVTVVFPVWLTILIVLVVLVLLLFVVPLMAGVWFMRKCVEIKRQTLKLRWFPVKQVRDDEQLRNMKLLLTLPLYTAPLLWMMYKNLKEKYLHYKEQSECLDVYVALKRDNEEGMSKLKSEEQKQRVLFHLINDLNDHVDTFRFEHPDESCTEEWKKIENVNRLLQHINNTSLSPENHDEQMVILMH